MQYLYTSFFASFSAFIFSGQLSKSADLKAILSCSIAHFVQVLFEVCAVISVKMHICAILRFKIFRSQATKAIETRALLM